MKENEYLLLLFKRLSGEISAPESEQLDNWLAASEENEKLAREYSLIWNRTAGYEKVFTPDLNADFAKVQDRIKQETATPMRSLSVRTGWWRAAAAVTLLLAALWGYRSWNGATDNYFDTGTTALNEDKSLLQLSDGTKVWLRKGSSLEYAGNFAGKKNRRVKLKGEAYFEVAHDAAHPFRVELASGGRVEVLGTEFDVKQESNKDIVLVRSGRVRFMPNEHTQSPVLTANQKAVFDQKAGSLTISSLRTLNEISWQNNQLEFVKTPLSDVLRDLEAYFHVKIDLKNAALSNCVHSAVHQNPALDDILDALAVTYQLQITQAGPGSYVLSGGQCR